MARPTRLLGTSRSRGRPAPAPPSTMVSQRPRPLSVSLLSLFALFSLFSLLFSSPALAIKFELQGAHSPTQKCIWNYALSDTLIVITANAAKSHTAPEKQRLDIEIVDSSQHNNVYLHKKNIEGETRMAITTHANADLGVCFTNHLDHSIPMRVAHQHFTTIDLDVDIGADAVDYNAIANQESLSGLETEMRKLEAVVKEIVDELDYLKKREVRMRDTNESTNRRVQSFALLTIIALVCLGVWQVLHLRSFFKRKYLID